MLRRLQSNAGQGLFEVVLVMVVFSAAVAVATPMYLGFQSRKADKAAQESLVAAVHVAGAYRQDHGSFRGMDSVDLARIDPRVSMSLSVAWVRGNRYCLTETVHGRTWSLRAPYKRDPTFLQSGFCD